MSPALALDPPRYSPDPTLTPSQHHVLALLAEGHTLSYAAQAAGIHRNTIRNWRRAHPAFAREIEFAVHEQALVWHEQSLELAPRAAQVLHDTLHNPETKPHLRLRAALAVLKTAAEPQLSPAAALFPLQTLEQQIPPTAVHNLQTENPAQSCTTAPIRKAPEPGRNSVCPCGSGQKYKRCCGSVIPAGQRQSERLRFCQVKEYESSPH